jgi:hypothetical protein
MAVSMLDKHYAYFTTCWFWVVCSAASEAGLQDLFDAFLIGNIIEM